MRIFLSFFILIFLAKSIAGFAQNPCAIALSEAEDKYDQGRLYDIEGILKECLKGFTNEEKIRAYRLLTLTNLFLNYEEKADSSFLKLLNVVPIYKTDEDLDPLELINHSKKFTTKPKYILSAKIGTTIGATISSVSPLLDYSISISGNDPKTYKYSPDFGFIIGGGAEMVIWKDLHLAGEIFFSGKRIHLSDTQFGFYTTNLDIVHREIELPIMLKYNFFKWQVNPYFFGGVSPSFIVQSSMRNIDRTYQDLNDVESVANLQLQDIVATSMKKRFNYSVLFGVGINYRIGLNYVTLEARYSKEMLNVADKDKRYSISSQKEIPGESKPIKNTISGSRDAKFPLGHIDDDSKMDKLSIMVGFVYPLYKPRKIK